MSGKRARILRQQIIQSDIDPMPSGYVRTKAGALRCLGLRAVYKRLKKAWKMRGKR